MTIILPQPPGDSVWVHAPTWLFAGFHWAWVLIPGGLLFAAAVELRRFRKDFATGLLLILSLAPAGIGLVGALGAGAFWLRPTPSTSHQTWSRTQTGYHDFKVPSSRIAHRYQPPPRNPADEIAYVNASIASHMQAKNLHPNDMPLIVDKSSSEANIAAARKGGPFLVNSEVYTCAFLADASAHDANGGLARAEISSAVCVQGSKSVFLKI